MFFHFSIWPLDDVHMSKDIALITEKFNAANIAYELGAMGITVEGDWDDVMLVIRECHREMVASHPRVLTQITIDQPPRRKTIAESIRHVQECAR